MLYPFLFILHSFVFFLLYPVHPVCACRTLCSKCRFFFLLLLCLALSPVMQRQTLLNPNLTLYVLFCCALCVRFVRACLPVFSPVTSPSLLAAGGGSGGSSWRARTRSCSRPTPLSCPTPSSTSNGYVRSSWLGFVILTSTEEGSHREAAWGGGELWCREMQILIFGVGSREARLLSGRLEVRWRGGDGSDGGREGVDAVMLPFSPLPPICWNMYLISYFVHIYPSICFFSHLQSKSGTNPGVPMKTLLTLRYVALRFVALCFTVRVPVCVSTACSESREGLGLDSIDCIYNMARLGL